MAQNQLNISHLNAVLYINVKIKRGPLYSNMTLHVCGVCLGRSPHQYTGSGVIEYVSLCIVFSVLY